MREKNPRKLISATQIQAPLIGAGDVKRVLTVLGCGDPAPQERLVRPFEIAAYVRLRALVEG